MDLKSIEAQLKEIRELLEREHGPSAVTMREAARLLSCSEKHISRLVHRGEITTVMVGTLRRVSMLEIRRITSAPEVGQRQEPLRRQPKYSASMVEAEYLKLRGRGKPKKKR
jgi:excisionase family DNA binding protein